MEIWKDIKGYEGYQVSNLGRVRTHNKITYTEKHVARHWKDRILKFKGKTKATGYRVDLWKDGKPHSLLVARLVAFTFLDKDINNHELTVNHIDGNRFNNNIENLELISLKENIQHAFRTGLMPTNKRIKIENTITGSIIYAPSLAEGSKLMGMNECYLSHKIKKNEWKDKQYKWKLINSF